MARCAAPVIGLLVGLAPVLACAQTNIDQGKTPAQIFANDCAACHKGPRGLANGQNSLSLIGFLREHYTASREQAAALAAYVLGAGGNEGGSAAQSLDRDQKAKRERARSTTEERKTTLRQSRRPGKSDDETPAAMKDETPAASDEATPAAKDGTQAAKSTSGHDDGRAGKTLSDSAATRGPATAGAGAGALPSAAPTSNDAPTADVTPAPAAAPAPAQSDAGSGVPRDNIPD